MEKRVLIAVFLSFLVLFVYQALFVPRRPPTPTARNAPRADGRTTAPAAAATAPSEPAVQPSQPAASARAEEPRAESLPVPLLADREERESVVETPAVRAVFSNRGAVLKSWRLKKYLDASRQPLELVVQDVPGSAARPFSLDLGDPAATATLAAALFKPSAVNVTAAGDSDDAVLTFEYRDAEGLAARKEFRFRPRSAPYVVTLSVEVEVGGKAVNPTIAWGPGIGAGTDAGGSRYYTPPRAVLFADGKVARIRADKIAQQPTTQGTLPFAGVEDHYFLSAEVGGGAGVRVIYAPLQIERPAEQGGPRQLVSYAVQYPNPQAASFFVGPKDFDVLAAVDRDLVRAIDFGIFAWLVVPLLRALKWIDSFIGNYGWSIIILTVLINAAMFPLRHKSVVSMRKMQEIQPEVKAIQERYSKLKATDPARQKMNSELMGLYRERGVNPAGGCLPMLLTMPVLFAFYSLLSVAIELRGAPFVGWIHDLSAPDPLYVTPILMGATMVIQQRMTPTAGDPMQQKMMMFMPIIFTGMFLWAPSGLVIYWFVSNLWGIGQQWVTNRIIGPPRIRAARPAAERRVKSAGGGRTEQAARDEAARERTS